jgi:ribose transport system substrate-binding protein
MSKECTGVEIVARQTANFNRAEGLTVFENILQAQPDINGTFAHNDEMILGAIEAAEAAGRGGIVFVGFDAVDDAVAAVNAERLAATIAQQPAEMGRLGVETSISFLDGQGVDSYIPVDLSLVSGTIPQPTEAPPEPTDEPPPAAFSLGLSLSTLNNPFFVTLRDGAQAAADSAGSELIVVDAQDDPAREATNIEDLIQRGVSALLINPTDADAIVPSIQKANDAGIPVFTVDRGANGGTVISHIASDNVAGGAAAGSFLCEALGGAGNVVELEGIAGTSAARDRGQGFNDYMSQECTGVAIVARQTANFNRAEGLTVYENILQAQPEIAGTFAHNDEMILGAIEAAEAAGRAEVIIFVGFDAVDDAVQAVRDGRLAATVAQQPAVMGQLGVDVALRYLNGEQVEGYIPVDLSMVTPETVQ